MRERLEYWLVVAVARSLGWMPRQLARLLADGVASWQGGKPIEAVIALRGNAKPVAAMVLEDRG